MNGDETNEPENLIAAAIDAAEDIRDPLEGLVERTATDPGAPFAPDTLVRLAALKKDDRAAFEVLRAQLKSAGCRVTALDEAIAEESGEVGGRGPKQADILIDLAQSAELFHAPDGTGFADLDINGHRETWPIRAKGFRRWLARRFFEATQGAPSSEALQSALNVIEAKAHFDAPERVVHIRVGGLDGRLYLDLGDATWRAVEIDATGWRVIDNPPVRFRRAAGMQPSRSDAVARSTNASQRAAMHSSSRSAIKPRTPRGATCVGMLNLCWPSPLESELRVDLVNRSMIRLYGADNPDALRGPYLDGVVLDENLPI